MNTESPWQLTWQRLRRNKPAMTGLVVLGVLYFAALFAPMLSPCGFATQHREANWQPPRIDDLHLWDDQGEYRGLFVYRLTRPDAYAPWEEDRSQIVPIELFASGEKYTFAGMDFETHLFGTADGSPLFLLGSDKYGRDQFTRILHGARISLSVGLIGVLISMTLGMLVGGIAGYFGGKVDFGLMRLVELILAVPGLYLILTVRQTFGQDMSSTASYFVMVLVLSFIGWAANARVIRGMVLSIKGRDYVTAAQALGLPKLTIITRHILPNTLSYVIVTATLSIPYYILGEVALSFLGVGIQEPDPSWGNMLQEAQNTRYLTDFWWVIIPGFFIFCAVMAFNFLGDGLRDAADPRSSEG